MSTRLFRPACAAALLALLGCLSAASAAEDAPTEADLQRTISGAKAQMERAFATLRADRVKLRAEGFAATVSDHPGFVSVLGALVAAAPKEPEGGTGDAVAAALTACRALDPPPPLSPIALEGVFPHVVRAARKDTALTGVAGFVAAAQHVFRHESLADAWDESFTGTELVLAYRTAQTRLASLRAEAQATSPTDPYARMVLVPREKTWVGPWDGWNHTIKAKQNKRQRVTLKAFYVDPTEVTCAAYLRFLSAAKAKERKALLPKGWTLPESGEAQYPKGRGAHPVTGVSFEQAAAFAESLGKRLPTEDEWERVAAGAGEAGRTYPWGDAHEGVNWNHGGGDESGTSAVSEFPQDVTPEGVRGLAGNVSEIVATLPDRKNIRGSRLPKDGQAVARGGSYLSRAARCTTRYRTVVDPADGAATIGFRCVMDESDHKKRVKQD